PSLTQKRLAWPGPALVERDGAEGIAVPSRSQSRAPHGVCSLWQEHSHRSGPSPSPRRGGSWRLAGNVGARRHGERESEGLPDLYCVLSGWLATAGLCPLTQAASGSVANGRRPAASTTPRG